jgi:hypothetical protein
MRRATALGFGKPLQQCHAVGMMKMVGMKDWD